MIDDRKIRWVVRLRCDDGTTVWAATAQGNPLAFNSRREARDFKHELRMHGIESVPDELDHTDPPMTVYLVRTKRGRIYRRIHSGELVYTRCRAA